MKKLKSEKKKREWRAKIRKIWSMKMKLLNKNSQKDFLEMSKWQVEDENYKWDMFHRMIWHIYCQKSMLRFCTICVHKVNGTLWKGQAMVRQEGIRSGNKILSWSLGFRNARGKANICGRGNGEKILDCVAWRQSVRKVRLSNTRATSNDFSTQSLRSGLGPSL